MSKVEDSITLAVDANDSAAATPLLIINGNLNVIFQIRAASGTHTTHVFKLQQSIDDGNTWFNTGEIVTGVGLSNSCPVTADMVRVKSDTVEGAASTVDIIIKAK